MFEYEFPLYVLVREFTNNPGPPPSLDIHDIVTLADPRQPTAVALFTDQDGAEQFRDEHAPGHRVLGLPTAAALVRVLQVARQIADAVAFDPFRTGLRTNVALIDDMIRFHVRPPGGPNPCDDK